MSIIGNMNHTNNQFNVPQNEEQNYDNISIDDIIQKQYLKKLEYQIKRRNSLLDGLSIDIFTIWDIRYGTITVKWKDPLDSVVLERYWKYYA